MGSIVEVKCGCGVNTEIEVGSGIRDFGTVCNFPCLCEDCHKLVEVNLLDKKSNVRYATPKK